MFIFNKILRLASLFFRKVLGFARGYKDLLSDFPVEPYIFTPNDTARVSEVVLSGKLHHNSGSEVRKFESEFSRYIGSKLALATNSGTSAIELALKSIGLLPGDEVIVPAYTFVATAQAVLARGGIPVFADIDDTFTLDPFKIESLITKKTKALIAVHLFGNVAAMDKIMHIARKHKLFVIEDACQSVGASFDGKKVGSIGDIGCFSFDIKKAIYTGQGGMITTSHKKFFDTALHTKEMGQLRDETGSDVITTGNNYALTEIQAVLGRSILEKLDMLNEKRKHNYDLFCEFFDTRYLPVRWYRTLQQATPSFSRLVFMMDFENLKITRKEFLANTRKSNLPLKTFYPVALYKYSLFVKKKDLFTGNTFPFSLNTKINYKELNLAFAEKFCDQQFGMEFSPYLTDNHIKYLTSSLRQKILAYL